MALTDYAITALGAGRIAHNGVGLHSGRLVTLESTNQVTQLLLAAGYITATLGGATLHDVKSTTPVGTQDAEGLTLYHITPAGAQHINHNGVTLGNGAALSLDALEDTAKYFLAKGWIS